MARNRMIQSGFWADEKLGRMSHTARLLFIGLWTFAEDNAVGRANPSFLAAHIFPYDDVKGEEITKMMKNFQKEGMISLFSVKKEQLYHITNFKKYQYISHPTPPRLPDFKAAKKKLLESSCSTTGVLQEDSTPKEKKGKEKKGKENKEKESKRTAYGCDENVYLSAEEFRNLSSLFGEDRLKKLIEKMSLYQTAEHKTYRDHYLALRLWNEREREPNNKTDSVASDSSAEDKYLEFTLSAIRALGGESKHDE